MQGDKAPQQIKEIQLLLLGQYSTDSTQNQQIDQQHKS